jgi:poly-gamma-glutamate synthesis protein (capsule biosynthesis protein)
MGRLTLLATGDIILGENPAEYFRGVHEMLLSADIVAGQLEVPYSDEAPELADLNRETRNLEPLKQYFHILSLAGNHIYDAGDTGVRETIGWLKRNNILYVGGGLEIMEARGPRIIEKNRTRIGFLSYNCTGPKIMSATKTKPGCAALDIITHYELGDVANPGGPPEKIYSWPEPGSLAMMLKEIRLLRQQCDVLCLYLHKGLVHKPVKLADYEQLVSYAAIDAGADVIFSTHPHILHGVETYKGKTIYHSLGNFIAWVPSLSPGFRASRGVKNDHFDPEEWARTRIERFGFVPDPEYPTYPFHKEALFCMTAKCVIDTGVITDTRYIPMIVDKSGVPELVSRDNGGQEVFNYVQSISRKALLNAEFAWDGDEIVIH